MYSVRRASRSAVSKDFTLTLISVFRDCLLHFKATLTETYLKISHALGKTVVTESKALSFCPYSKTISSFHSEIVISECQGYTHGYFFGCNPLPAGIPLTFTTACYLSAGQVVGIFIRGSAPITKGRRCIAHHLCSRRAYPSSCRNNT